MDKYKLGDMEELFARLLWKNAPLSTREMVQLCEKEFMWKRTTTYTMFKRLCERGIFENRDGMVVALLSREDFLLGRGESFLDDNFGGSLPMFIAAFTRKKKLSDDEINEIQKLINEYEEGL